MNRPTSSINFHSQPEHPEDGTVVVVDVPVEELVVPVPVVVVPTGEQTGGGGMIPRPQ